MQTKKLQDFSLESDGLYCGDLFLASFNPILEKIICSCDLDSGKEKLYYFVKIKLPDGKELPGYLFSKLSDIHFFDIWYECCDAGISKKQRELLYLYLQLQAQNAKKEKEYRFDRLGMYEKVFVFDRMNIFEILQKEQAVYIPGRELPDFQCKKIEKNKKMEYLCKMLTVKKGVSEVLFLCSLFSVLKPLMQDAGYQVGFIVALYGKSGVGKTQLARTFFVQDVGQEKNFKTSSRKEIEWALSLFEGHSVLIDDFHPEALSYGQKRQESILDFIARKSDMDKSALAVITAEFLGGCFSIQDRMLQVKIEGNDLDFTTLSFLQKNRGVMVSILKDFAELVYCKRSEVTETVKYMMNIYSIKESSRRISFTVNMLKATLEVFWSCFLDDDDKKEIRSKTKDENIKQTIIGYLDNVEKDQIKAMERLERLEGGVDWILVLYEMLHIHQIFVLCPELKDIDDPEFNGMAVLDKKNKICIRSQTLKKGLELFFGFKVSIKDMIKELLEEHILEEDRSCSHMKKKADGKYYYEVNDSLLELYYRNQCKK